MGCGGNQRCSLLSQQLPGPQLTPHDCSEPCSEPRCYRATKWESGARRSSACSPVVPNVFGCHQTTSYPLMTSRGFTSHHLSSCRQPFICHFSSYRSSGCQALSYVACGCQPLSYLIYEFQPLSYLSYYHQPLSYFTYNHQLLSDLKYGCQTLSDISACHRPINYTCEDFQPHCYFSVSVHVKEKLIFKDHHKQLETTSCLLSERAVRFTSMAFSILCGLYQRLQF